jgi:hypothetical protein
MPMKGSEKKSKNSYISPQLIAFGNLSSITQDSPNNDFQDSLGSCGSQDTGTVC